MAVDKLHHVLTVVLWMLPFAVGGRLGFGATNVGRNLLSASGGISVAYVFVDILPEMSRMQEAFDATAASRSFTLAGYRVYIAGLIGFVTFYVLENMHTISPTSDSGSGEHRSDVQSRIRIGGFAAYAGLIGCLVEIHHERTIGSTLLYGFAMLCHFWIVDQSLRAEHHDWYDDVGRWLIATAILLGWTVGMAGALSELALPTLLGLLGGGVVVNGVKSGLPGRGGGEILPFVAGAFGFALLLMTVGGR